MLTRIIFALTVTVGIAGCGGDGGESLPTTEFSEDYVLADFNLRSDVEYWEIRLGPLPREEPAEFEVMQSYGDINALDGVQSELLQNATSQSGFAPACAPSFCPIYAVAITGYDVTIIDSSVALAEFFGGIDTEAELHTYLDHASGYQYSTQPLKYKKVEDGYQVILHWDTLCQRRGEDLVKVYADGTVEKMREISTETYSSCA